MLTHCSAHILGGDEKAEDGRVAVELVDPSQPLGAEHGPVESSKAVASLGDARLQDVEQLNRTAEIVSTNLHK